MLGTLARWLRIAGYDTIYHKDNDDQELILEAEASKRYLLTRDRDLVQRAVKNEVKAIYIESEKVRDQLTQLKEVLNLKLEPSISRCPLCNCELSRKSKEEVSDYVPETSLNAFNEFWVCQMCEKVYWKGSHWDKIVETLEEF